MYNLSYKTRRQDLQNKGFKFNRSLSNNNEDWFTLRFPVLFYKNKATVECEIATISGENFYTINVYNANTRDFYIPYYNNDFGKYVTIKKIEKMIFNKLKSIGFIDEEKEDKNNE